MLGGCGACCLAENIKLTSKCETEIIFLMAQILKKICLPLVQNTPNIMEIKTLLTNSKYK
jgi:hypothetical protein